MPALCRRAGHALPWEEIALLDAATVVAGTPGHAGDVIALSCRTGQWPGGQRPGGQHHSRKRPGGQHPGRQRPAEVAATSGGGQGSGPVRLFTGTYPGTPDQAHRARADLATALAGCPAADDVLICLAEIAANAIIHSRSGTPGGHFGVRADARPGQWVQVAVEDDGGPWDGHHARDGAEYGRGLQIVRALSVQMGVTSGGRGRTVWFRCPWRPGAEDG